MKSFYCAIGKKAHILFDEVEKRRIKEFRFARDLQKSYPNKYTFMKSRSPSGEHLLLVDAEQYVIFNILLKEKY